MRSCAKCSAPATNLKGSPRCDGCRVRVLRGAESSSLATCIDCDKEFVSKARRKRCNTCCQIRYRRSHRKPCPGCGVLINASSTNCRSCAASGSGSHRWRGGRYVNRDGYVMVYMPEHPKGHPYVREHVIVLEEVLGRRLREFETVHHKNGQRSDNRPENLELWASKQPKGQRVTDLVEWATEILRLYGQ